MEESTRRRRPRARSGEFTFDRFPSGESRYVSGSFESLDEARDAVRTLEDHGYPASEISVLMTDATRRHYLRTHPEFEGLDPEAYLVDRVELEKENKSLKGAGTGGAIGGAIGAVAAAVAAIGTTLVIPPLGIVIAGPLAAAFAGAGAGGAVGGLVGALTGAGMSEYRAKRLEKVLKEGRIIVVVRARTEPERNDIRSTMIGSGGSVVQEEEVDGDGS